MRTVITTLCAASIVACFVARPLDQRPYVGWLPPHTHVDLNGTFTFSPEGELSLALAEPCTVGDDIRRSAPCDRAHLDVVYVVATTPWHSRVPGTWTDAHHLVFRVDWKNSGLDPLADDAATVVTLPWAILGSIWRPNAIEAHRILQLVGEATDTQPDLIAGGGPPHLEVTQFEVSGGVVHAGGESTLIVRIANRGPETAYRVVATTRSSVASLHGWRMGFGLIKPGTEKVRRLRLTVPASEASPDAMLVLLVGEGNGFPAHKVSQRITIAAPTSASMLAVRCSIPGHSASRPDLDAGDYVVLHCVVDNSGTAASEVELETSIGGAIPGLPSPMQSVAPAGQASFDLPITIPRELTIDSTVEIAIVARDRRSARSARTVVVGVVRQPKLCMEGRLTRAQYLAKIAKLRAEVAAGDLTQAQFDRYDAELVTCLQ